MTKQEFIKWAKSKGWQEDKFGHLQKAVPAGHFRFKLSKILVRYEVQITLSPDKHEWVRRNSGYYKDLSINPEGKLSGMKR
jgi:hypothetical protein